MSFEGLATEKVMVSVDLGLWILLKKLMEKRAVMWQE